MRKKKQRQTTYDTLVRVSQNVVMTILMEKCDKVQLGKIQSWFHVTNEDTIGVSGCHSVRNWQGGKAPYDIKELLTFLHLHKMRKEWINFFFVYYKMFIPTLTKKLMWQLILNRRAKRNKEQEDYYNKPSIPVLCDRDFYPGMVDRFGFKPTAERLYPLKESQYLSFWRKSKQFNTEQNRKSVKARIEDHYKKVYVYNNTNVEFDIIDGTAFLIYI